MSTAAACTDESDLPQDPQDPEEDDNMDAEEQARLHAAQWRARLSTELVDPPFPEESEDDDPDGPV